MSAPFLKWVGGKSKLLHHILPRLPSKIDGIYYEPFTGGGSVFFALAKEKRIKQAYLNDQNMELVVTYMVVKSHVDQLIERLKYHAAKHNQLYYYETRAKNVGHDPIEIASRFIYLNKTCFNGLYRVNRSGQFNVPIGRYANPTVCDEPRLRAASEALQMAIITNKDFSQVLRGVDPKDCVYLDPPYVPISDTSYFTAFTKVGFNMADQNRLSDDLVTLSTARVPALLSNSDCSETRKLYDYKDLIVERITAPRSINSDPENRGNVGELLVSTHALVQQLTQTPQERTTHGRI